MPGGARGSDNNNNSNNFKKVNEKKKKTPPGLMERRREIRSRSLYLFSVPSVFLIRNICIVTVCIILFPRIHSDGQRK